MKVLIACEESQAVCKEFRRLGHEAYSCDIIECSGGHPEWHIQGDVLPLLSPGWVNRGDDIPASRGYEFFTQDGRLHFVAGKWDMIIAFPPCTYLTVAGNRWFNVERYGEKAVQRAKDREEAINFFMAFANADCDRIAIENPVGIMSSKWRKPNQIIQPYYFGDRARKGTCLWLKGVPELEPTNMVDPGEILAGGYSVGASANYAVNSNGKALRWSDPETAKIRSKTFPGIAKAMAEQWGGETP